MTSAKYRNCVNNLLRFKFEVNNDRRQHRYRKLMFWSIVLEVRGSHNVAVITSKVWLYELPFPPAAAATLFMTADWIFCNIGLCNVSIENLSRNVFLEGCFKYILSKSTKKVLYCACYLVDKAEVVWDYGLCFAISVLMQW